jgi:hypothetical protein
MAKFMIVHRFVGDPEESYKAMNAPELVQKLVMTNGKTNPAKCVYTWIPYNYGRKDYYGFCLWEADSVEDIKVYLESLLNYITVDIMQVDELVWEQLAASMNVPA